MNPSEKLMWAIVAKRATDYQYQVPEYPCNNAGDLYDELVEEGENTDAEEEIREGEVETGLPCEWSRNYESKAVAMKFPDGSWVGWTYWYGGGKHGQPESIDWINDAYDLDCHEEEKLVVVRTFTKR